MASTAEWLKHQLYTRDPTPSGLFREHPNYEAWMAALTEMGRAQGYPYVPTVGQTPNYCDELVAAGADPEQIKATFALLFL